ncbi:MAG: hypothetical protein K2M53_06760 [Muribaculaceae bacterium]|nr:hypothetical protein [Muribaculaceae bacterium]
MESLRYKEISFIIFAAVLFSCKEYHNKGIGTKHESGSITELSNVLNVQPGYLNSVKGHKEDSLITGNFTGLGVDTIYVVEEEIDSIHDMYERYKFYAKSNNPELPTIEIFGYGGATPLLVYEGDVDGDGKDEWGYLHTWMNSQWRQYRIYNYDSRLKEWRFLYYDGENDEPYLLSTPEYVRASGVDIVEKGPKPGYIKINYGIGDAECKLRDTIVRPTYTRISKEAW